MIITVAVVVVFIVRKFFMINFVVHTSLIAWKRVTGTTAWESQSYQLRTTVIAEMRRKLRTTRSAVLQRSKAEVVAVEEKKKA